MSETNNAVCSICGTPYHVCASCLAQKTFRPWRTVTDTMEHYKIYLAIHDYTVSGDKKQAREQLQNCDLSESEHFRPEIKTAIETIMDESAQS